MDSSAEWVHFEALDPEKRKHCNFTISIYFEYLKNSICFLCKFIVSQLSVEYRFFMLCDHFKSPQRIQIPTCVHLFIAFDHVVLHSSAIRTSIISSKWQVQKKHLFFRNSQPAHLHCYVCVLISRYEVCVSVITSMINLVDFCRGKMSLKDTIFSAVSL